MTALVLIGVALRVWAYASNASLYLDEILLARNILGLSLTKLVTAPLLLDQVAPKGFLVLEKLAVMGFGENELALRLVPFLASIAGVLLFRRLAERALSGWAPPVALALFAIAIPLLRYAAQVKQYELDATASVLLLLLAIKQREEELSTPELLGIGLVGFVVIWFSQASVIVMAGIGLALALDWLLSKDRRSWRALTVSVPLWAIASGVAILAGLRSMTPATQQFMDDFWGGGFVPLPFRAATAGQWLWTQSASVFTDESLLRYQWPALFIAVAIIGVLALWRERRFTALVLLGPSIVALVAAVAHQYPLRGRLMVYLVPATLLALAAGADGVRRLAGRVHPALGIGALVLLLAAPAAALPRALPPYDLEQNRALIGYIADHRRPGDRVHVFPLARVGMLFYGPERGLQPTDWTTSACDRADTRVFIRDVDQFRGSPRVWLLTSGSLPYRPARTAVHQYLGTIGIKRDSLVLPSLTYGPVSVELYDLTDSTRLRSANAETFPVPRMPTNPRPGCRPWVKPSPIDTFGNRR
jgi:hypothetical protein